MIKEIGGEFWESDETNNEPVKFGSDYIFFLSGRTALDFLIRDIKEKNRIETVYIPSYCCYTMIDPFISNDVRVLFYDVFLNEYGGFLYDIDYNTPCDAVLVMNYYGYNDKNINDIAFKFKNLGKIIIEDVTHSIFSNIQDYSFVDYRFGSYRKWTALYTGGFVFKSSGRYNVCQPNETNCEYVELRKKATQLKADYFYSIISEKSTFLSLFNSAENLLGYDYRDYTIDKISLSRLERLDITGIIEKRRENTETLLSLIKETKNIRPIYPIMSKYDVPLFVPVIVNNGKRDELKKFLINNNIYCPIHWPISESHKLSAKNTYIYDNVLSLICDQRYNKENMLYIAEKIIDFERQQY